MTDQYLPQPYPLWCAEVDAAQEDPGKAVTVGRVVGWWVVEQRPDAEYCGYDLVPVVAQGEPIKRISSPHWGGDEADLYLADTAQEARQLGQDRFRELDGAWKAKQAAGQVAS